MAKKNKNTEIENKSIEAENKAVEMENKKVMIRFITSYALYTIGDMKGVDKATAERLVKGGFAEIIK